MSSKAAKSLEDWRLEKLNCEHCHKCHHGSGHTPKFRPRVLTYCSCLLHTNVSLGTEPTVVSLMSPSHPVLTRRQALLCLDALLTLPGGVYETNGTWDLRWFCILFFSLHGILLPCVIRLVPDVSWCAGHSCLGCSPTRSPYNPPEQLLNQSIPSCIWTLFSGVTSHIDFLYEQCCHTNSAFIISLIPYGIGFLSLFNELNFHILFSRYHLCHCLQSAELCLLPQSWDSHLLLPNSISTISHSFSCVRKYISEPTQPPELPQFVISKMNRINCFTENKLCSWWNITSIWEGDVCVL